MRNLLSTLVLASVGVVLGTGDASAFFRKKKKCQPAPVVTYVANPCEGMSSYSGSSYYPQQSAYPTYSQSNYGNYGYNNYGYGGNSGYNNSLYNNAGYNNYGYGGNSPYNNAGYNNNGYGTGRSMLGNVGSVGNGILSMPGNLYNRIR